MTDTRYISQAEYVRLKSRLTRAINSKDPRKVLAECAYFRDYFANGLAMPDNWSRWQRAADDAYFAALRSGDRTAERVDL